MILFLHLIHTNYAAVLNAPFIDQAIRADSSEIKFITNEPSAIESSLTTLGNQLCRKIDGQSVDWDLFGVSDRRQMPDCDFDLDLYFDFSNFLSVRVYNNMKDKFLGPVEATHFFLGTSVLSMSHSLSRGLLSAGYSNFSNISILPKKNGLQAGGIVTGLGDTGAKTIYFKTLYGGALLDELRMSKGKMIITDIKRKIRIPESAEIFSYKFLEKTSFGPSIAFMEVTRHNLYDGLIGTFEMKNFRSWKDIESTDCSRALEHREYFEYQLNALNVFTHIFSLDRVLFTTKDANELSAGNDNFGFDKYISGWGKIEKHFDEFAWKIMDFKPTINAKSVTEPEAQVLRSLKVIRLTPQCGTLTTRADVIKYKLFDRIVGQFKKYRSTWEVAVESALNDATRITQWRKLLPQGFEDMEDDSSDNLQSIANMIKRRLSSIVETPFPRVTGSPYR